MFCRTDCGSGYETRQQRRGLENSTASGFRMKFKCKHDENHGCSFLQKLRTDLQGDTVSNGIFGAIKTSNLAYYEISETQRDIRTASCRSANYLECHSGSPTLGKVPSDVRITLRTEFSFFTQLVYTAYV